VIRRHNLQFHVGLETYHGGICEPGHKSRSRSDNKVGTDWWLCSTGS